MREPARRTNSSSPVNFNEPEVSEFPSGLKWKVRQTKLQQKHKNLPEDQFRHQPQRVQMRRSPRSKILWQYLWPGPTPPKKTSFADSSLLNTANGRAITPKQSLKKRLSFADDKPPLKRHPTFADDTVDSIGSRGPEKAGMIPGSGMPKSDPRVAIPTKLPPIGARVPGLTRDVGTKEDMWESAEIIKINMWEKMKRFKAKRGKEKTERELEQKRARALQLFRNEMETIDAVAGGARAEADKKKRKEELNVKTKAIKIRTTGKLPPRCFSF